MIGAAGVPVMFKVPRPRNDTESFWLVLIVVVPPGNTVIGILLLPLVNFPRTKVMDFDTGRSTVKWITDREREFPRALKRIRE